MAGLCERGGIDVKRVVSGVLLEMKKRRGWVIGGLGAE